MKYKRFSESDWDGFADAEEFEDGSNPVIAESKFLDAPFTGYILVVCGSGAEAMLVQEGYEGDIWSEEIWSKDQKFTRPPARLLEALPQEFSYDLLNELGFKQLS